MYVCLFIHLHSPLLSSTLSSPLLSSPLLSSPFLSSPLLSSPLLSAAYLFIVAALHRFKLHDLGQATGGVAPGLGAMMLHVLHKDCLRPMDRSAHY